MKINEFIRDVHKIDKQLNVYQYPKSLWVTYNSRTFIKIPFDAKTIFDCRINDELEELTDDIKITVSNKINKFLRTPIKERFPEKKYRLRWFDSDYTEDGFDEPATYLGRSTDDLGEMFWSTYTLDGAEVFTESQLEELKKENPLLAPAVDVMKEPVETSITVRRDNND